MHESKSLDEKFVVRMREIIHEQQGHIDSLTYDVSENNQRIIKLVSQIDDLAHENKKLLNTLNEEQYFLEKMNLHLELELAGKTKGGITHA